MHRRTVPTATAPQCGAVVRDTAGHSAGPSAGHAGSDTPGDTLRADRDTVPG